MRHAAKRPDASPTPRTDAGPLRCPGDGGGRNAGAPETVFSAGMPGRGRAGGERGEGRRRPSLRGCRDAVGLPAPASPHHHFPAGTPGKGSRSGPAAIPPFRRDPGRQQRRTGDGEGLRTGEKREEEERKGEKRREKAGRPAGRWPGEADEGPAIKALPSGGKEAQTFLKPQKIGRDIHAGMRPAAAKSLPKAPDAGTAPARYFGRQRRRKPLLRQGPGKKRPVSAKAMRTRIPSAQSGERLCPVQ